VKKGGAAPSIAELQEKRVVQVAQKWAEKTGAKWSVFDDSYEKDFLLPIRQLMARNHSNDPGYHVGSVAGRATCDDQRSEPEDTTEDFGGRTANFCENGWVR
jgi:hypothetical protein